MLWFCAHSKERHSSEADLLSDPYWRSHHGILTTISLMLNLDISNLNFSHEPPSIHLQFPVVHLPLGILSSHSTTLVWKGIHHLSSWYSSPVSINHAITAQKKILTEITLTPTHIKSIHPSHISLVIFKLFTSIFSSLSLSVSP